LEALSVVGLETPSHRLLDRVNHVVKKVRRQYRALRPISPDDASLFQAILHGEHSLQGFRNRDVRKTLGDSDPKNSSARVSRLLALLRAHKLIYKVFKANLRNPRNLWILYCELLERLFSI
jgi:tryptophan 2,3-dioxygenase